MSQAAQSLEPPAVIDLAAYRERRQAGRRGLTTTREASRAGAPSIALRPQVWLCWVPVWLWR